MKTAASSADTPRPKILLFNMTLSGGAGKYIVTLADALRQEGVEVHIIIYKDAVDYEIPEEVGFHMLLEGKRWKERKSVERALRQKLDELAPFDLILSNSTPSNKLLSRLNLPNACHVVHSAETKSYSGPLASLKRWWRDRTYRQLYSGKRLITVSKGLKRAILEDLKARPLSVETIYNPFDFDEIRRKSEEPVDTIPEEKYIINVARFSLVQKRQDLLLKAYKKADIPHKLVLLGQGEDEGKIRRLVEELGLRGKVILPGFSDNPYAWIRRSELFVLSSDFEGFPRSLVEAAVLEVPIVSTDCPTGPDELLTGEWARYLALPSDADDLAEKIDAALHSPYPRIDTAALSHFSHRKIAQRLLRLAGGQR